MASTADRYATYDANKIELANPYKFKLKCCYLGSYYLDGHSNILNLILISYSKLVRLSRKSMSKFDIPNSAICAKSSPRAVKSIWKLIFRRERSIMLHNKRHNSPSKSDWVGSRVTDKNSFTRLIVIHHVNKQESLNHQVKNNTASTEMYKNNFVLKVQCNSTKKCYPNSCRTPNNNTAWI